MNTPALFKEYIWLVNTIHKSRRITLDEINERWTRTEMSGGVPFSRTTFYRHKMAIEDMFRINPDFDAEQFFCEYFGVWTDGKTPLERIVIRAFGQEQYYLDDLPLHNSQHVVAEGDDYTDFEFRLRPTPDFKSHLLSLGARIRILQPQWLADEIRQMHREASEEN